MSIYRVFFSFSLSFGYSTKDNPKSLFQNLLSFRYIYYRYYCERREKQLFVETVTRNWEGKKIHCCSTVCSAGCGAQWSDNFSVHDTYWFLCPSIELTTTMMTLLLYCSVFVCWFSVSFWFFSFQIAPWIRLLGLLGYESFFGHSMSHVSLIIIAKWYSQTRSKPLLSVSVGCYLNILHESRYFLLYPDSRTMYNIQVRTYPVTQNLMH